MPNGHGASGMLKITLMVLMYYPLSIGLTFYQKWFIKNYGLPLVCVTGHYFTKYVFAVVVRYVLECCRQRRARLSIHDQLRWLAPIGICASVDIGLSNWALEYVTVSLYTMAKSSSILFIVAFSLLLHLERWRPSLGLTATLIAVGLFLFTWQASQLDMLGLLLVELAAASTGVRWTVSQLVMQRDDHTALRNPLDMVIHVQPWMVLAILPLLFVFEGGELTLTRIFMYANVYQPLHVTFLIVSGGLLAFLMEMSEYLLLVHTSGITLNIFGIIKEVMTLLLAHHLNGDRLSNVNIFGLCLCLIGMTVHGASKRHSKSAPRTSSPTSLLSNGDSDRKFLLSLDCESA
ncbi:hypothetical protein QR680_007711 [Steinernema hermaphroditum]|uniref:Sugar phosphate transporter domain-containing protein n=1 Tax=Steinernema hermaphroditum TaxID=289476 RepID=A0AA39IGG3_9BILA|nr:hypothetical protein QR680_007711 [Steinernema hermaphroditum]